MSAASIAFLLDEHVAHAVAQALRRRGIDAQTATEAGLLGATDAEVLVYARQAGRVVVTHDDDFLRLHQRQPHAGIAFCTQGMRTIGQMVASLMLIFEVLEPADMVDQVEFLRCAVQLPQRLAPACMPCRAGSSPNLTAAAMPG